MRSTFKQLTRWLVLLVLPSIIYAADNTIRFLAIADIHFDPYAACYNSKGPCPLIQALQQASASEWPQLLKAHDEEPQKYRQDTNYALLHYSLQEAKKAAEKNEVQFVLVLGDFLAHDYRRYFKKYANNYSRANYHAFVKKTFEFLTLETSQAFPDITVYNVAGNNDSFSSDYGYYPRTGFFSETASIWSRLIKNKENRAKMQQQFSSAGYYAVDVNPAWKLIVLNTVLFSNKGIGRGINEAAANELSWLQQILQAAEHNHQKVLIAMHIPPGVDIYASLKFRLFRMIELWKLSDTERYEALLREYASEIAGIFAGHLHQNLLQQLTISNEKSVPSAGVPSISPYFGNNPGFNVYIFSGKTGILEKVKDTSYPLSRIAPALN